VLESHAESQAEERPVDCTEHCSGDRFDGDHPAQLTSVKSDRLQESDLPRSLQHRAPAY
jgi:hypothetical protein